MLGIPKQLGTAAALAALLGGCTGEIEAPRGVDQGEVPGLQGSGMPFGQAPLAGNGAAEPATAGVGANAGVGAAAGSSGPAAGTGAAGGAADRLAEACMAPEVGPSPLRRLSHREYENSVRDLLGDGAAPPSVLASDTEEGLFDNTASTQTVSYSMSLSSSASWTFSHHGQPSSAYSVMDMLRGWAGRGK